MYQKRKTHRYWTVLSYALIRLNPFTLTVHLAASNPSKDNKGAKRREGKGAEEKRNEERVTTYVALR